MTEKFYCESFPPIVTAKSRVLILGSMPGAKSLHERQYYAHPQNVFWKVMHELFGMPVGDYPQRIALIEKSGLALWDVLQSCHRPGSMDSDIKNAKPNDFKDFFKKYPNIRHVFFNGSKAAAEFKRKQVAFEGSIEKPVTLVSTSPAMASKNFAAKLKEWRAVKEALRL